MLTCTTHLPALELSYGAGLRNARFERVALNPAPGETLVRPLQRWLAGRPAGVVEAWWSLHLWSGETRSASAWRGSHGVVMDVDYHNSVGQHVQIPETVVAHVTDLVFSGAFPGNLFHMTPRGFRVIAVFDSPLSALAVWKLAAGALATRVTASLDDWGLAALGFKLDNAVQLDTARLIYAPNTTLGTTVRRADVLTIRELPYSLDELCTCAEVYKAAKEWNLAHTELAEDWPDSNGMCPACEHDKCFGRLPDLEDEPPKWFCFSANHETDSGGCGSATERGWMGSALDLEAHSQCISRVGFLDREGALQSAFSPPARRRDSVTLNMSPAAPDLVEDPVLDYLLDSVVAVSGTTTVIDANTSQRMTQEALRFAYPRQYAAWLKHDDRRVVSSDQVVFSPQGAEPGEINLFHGMPLEPRRGDCKAIVEHVYNICGYDPDLSHHMFCWLAWPLQHPGTKMGYALVVHGGQGTGKSLFFERLMMKLYGLEYSIQIGQTELESRFTGWLSRKLFVVCNEVSSSAKERRDARNRLKSIITDRWFAIEEKFLPVRIEENHANLVFLSNEDQPVLPEWDDRRYEIIRFDVKEDAEYYAKLAEEIDGTGAAAFYKWLLEYDCGVYEGAYAKPLQTEAKRVVTIASRTPAEQFLAEWEAGDTEFPFITCTASDLWLAFRLWCRQGGYYIPTRNAFSRALTNFAFRDRDTKLHRIRVGGRQQWVRQFNQDMDVEEKANQFKAAYNDAYVDYSTRVKI